MPGVKLGGGVLAYAGYQKSSVSLSSGQNFFPLLLTLCEDAAAFAGGDRGGLSQASTVVELK